MGCIDRRPGWLADQVDELVADDAALAGLEREEVVRLRSLAPRLREPCHRLGDGPLPNVLVHGDLHLSNVAQRGDGYLYFDWTDASVSNPLLELFGVLREENERIQAALLEIYLSAWVETGLGLVRDAVRAVEDLRAAYRAQPGRELPLHRGQRRARLRRQPRSVVDKVPAPRHRDRVRPQRRPAQVHPRRPPQRRCGQAAFSNSGNRACSCSHTSAGAAKRSKR
jgi:Phosphotransferase enzyme family